MKVIHAEDVNEALPMGLAYLKNQGLIGDSRNGTVLVAPTPVCTVYAKPTQRVLFSPTRDANPFFHFMESLWMLAGRNDVEFPAYYAGNIKTFSDDGKTLHGAYGYRWRKGQAGDQLEMIVEELKKNPESRRCVLQMWDATPEPLGFDDLYKSVNGGKDVPCNTHVYFDTIATGDAYGEDGVKETFVGKPVLNMTVCCRSNDVVWGAYGANAVHFSFLQEYVARSAGLPIGVYRQISNNYHVYANRPDVEKLMGVSEEFYGYGQIKPYPIMTNLKMAEFDANLDMFFEMWKPNKMLQAAHFHDDFWRHVVIPMVNAHHAYKADNLEEAIILAHHIDARDWQLACVKWLMRRQAARTAEGKV